MVTRYKNVRRFKKENTLIKTSSQLVCEGLKLKLPSTILFHCQGNSLSDRWSHLAAIWADLHVFDMSADRFCKNSKTIKADRYIYIYIYIYTHTTKLVIAFSVLVLPSVSWSCQAGSNSVFIFCSSPCPHCRPR
jgi:hypothetical protein